MPKLKPLDRDKQRARRDEVARKAEAGELILPEGVREMRRALGMTQARFATAFGLTREQVIALEKGRANPTLDTLNRIGRPFGFRAGFIRGSAPYPEKREH